MVNSATFVEGITALLLMFTFGNFMVCVLILDRCETVPAKLGAFCALVLTVVTFVSWLVAERPGPLVKG
jgi:hypothetical protein